jgi:23S rRNA pseudouridine1911/1915/1917 synthase
MKQFTYEWEEIRCDKALSLHLQISRNTIEHLFKSKRITVNWEYIKRSSILQLWSKVVIDDSVIEQQDDYIFQNSAAIEILVLHKTPDYRIIIKPRWILSHPTSVWELDQPSVAWFVAQQWVRVVWSWGAIRSWIVHRLDKDTEWLMIIAVSQKWMTYFWNLFQEKSTWDNLDFIKEYTALCKPNQQGIGFLHQTEFPYYFESDIEPKTPHSVKKIGKSVIQSAMNWSAHSRITIQIITWRTHQVRIQLAQLWLPIVWDQLYWISWKFLHLTASKLEFNDPDWVKQLFQYSENRH